MRALCGAHRLDCGSLAAASRQVLQGIDLANSAEWEGEQCSGKRPELRREHRCKD